jgi:protein arginine N-methyltransferase 1
MYSAQDYDAMLADAGRTAAYLSSIKSAVHPGSVVVEIGTGVGYFAVAACAAGARRVYAIEVNPVVELAAQVAADNGCADRITFISDDSRRVTLPERGDVLLSDLRGVLPLFGDHIPSIADARKRLVVPGATLIPLRDTLWAAPCAAPEGWRRDHIAIGEKPGGIDRRAVAARIRSDWYQCRIGAGDLFAPGVQWAALDYTSIEAPSVSGNAEWTVAREGELDGLALWFEGDLGFGARISNSPLDERRLYGQAFFPLERSLRVKAEDRLSVELRANHAGDDYFWAWNTLLTPAAPASKAVAFQQTNLASRVVSLERLRRLEGTKPEDDHTFSTIPSTG